MRTLSRLLIVASVCAAIASCGVVPLPPSRWKVDVVNGPEPVIVSITTDAAAWAWTIAPRERLVLLDLRQAPNEGTITLIGPGTDCEVLDSFSLPPTSFTVIDRPDDGATFVVELGAGLAGAPSTEFEGACSG